MHGYEFVCWLFMAAGFHFSQSLMVSAYTPAMYDIQRNIPYLRTRCAHIGTGYTATPSSSPITRGGPFHPGARTFATNINRRDMVKRFKMSDANARETGAIPHHVIKRTQPTVVKTSDTPSELEFRPWSIHWSTLLEHAGETYFELGPDCSEKAYQTALTYKLYKKNIPCLTEKNMYMIEHGEPILTGRVDLECASKFILELKVSPSNANNIRKDKKQLRRYISAYKANGVYLERAALVYFGNSEVRIVEVSVDEDLRLVPY